MKDVEKEGLHESDYPKLLYGTNKLATEKNYIIRTQKPRFIAEILLFNEAHEAEDFMQQHSLPSVSTSIKTKTVVVAVKDFWDNVDDFEPKEIRLATKRLANWYKAQFLESLKRVNEKKADKYPKRRHNPHNKK